MTTTSLVASIALSIVVAWVAGWLLRRWNCSSGLASNWAFAIASAVAIPTLLSDSPQGIVRMVFPREAVDWLPVGLLGLATAMSFARVPRHLSSVSTILGSLFCFFLAYRFMWGSVYLLPSKIEIPSLLIIGIWGGMMACIWMSANCDIAVDTPQSWFAIVICCLILIALSLVLAMSGSLTYAAVGILLTVSSGACLLGTKIAPLLVMIAAIALLGLGIAYAEITVLSGSLLAVAIFGFSIAVNSLVYRFQAFILFAAAAFAITSVVLTAIHLQADLKGSRYTDGGYQSYK